MTSPQSREAEVLGAEGRRRWSASMLASPVSAPSMRPAGNPTSERNARNELRWASVKSALAFPNQSTRPFCVYSFPKTTKLITRASGLLRWRADVTPFRSLRSSSLSCLDAVV